MTPKEKAKDLVDKLHETLEFYVPARYAKQCALIAVDEILASHYKVLTGIHPTTYDYFIEVKKEIELL